MYNVDVTWLYVTQSWK